MALPTAGDLRDVIRGQTEADAALRTAMVLSATALVQAYLRRPIVAVSKTFVLPRPVVDPPYRPITGWYFPVYPIATSPAPVITDDDATVLVEATDYRIDYETGEVFGLPSTYFGTWPYTVVATVGLSARSDYDTMVEPVIFQAILDTAADLYQRRSPAATSETVGGTGTSYDNNHGLPQRVKEWLHPFQMVRAR